MSHNGGICLALQMYINETQLDKILWYFWRKEKKKFALITMILFYGGMRISELLTTKFEDYNLKKRWIYLNNVKGLNNGASQRIAYYPSYVEPYIIDHIKFYGLKKGDWMFQAHYEKEHYLDRTYYLKHLKEAGLETGVGPITPHVLRKSFGVNVTRKAKDLRVTQMLLGHRNARTTLQYYLPYLNEDVERKYIEIYESHK